MNRLGRGEHQVVLDGHAGPDFAQRRDPDLLDPRQAQRVALPVAQADDVQFVSRYHLLDDHRTSPLGD